MKATDVSELQVMIDGPTGLLEAIFTPASKPNLADAGYAVIICHPHPLYGGSLDNKVVTTLMRTYRDLGAAVLRFNFRGVGNSGGVFDHGKGELDDLLAVAAWLKQKLPNTQLLLAGFSFGSAIAAQACYRLDAVRHLLLAAPPVERYTYDQAGHFPCPVAVVQGDADERVVAQGVYDWVAGLTSPVTLLRYPQASHFFHGHLTALKADITELLRPVLA